MTDRPLGRVPLLSGFLVLACAWAESVAAYEFRIDRFTVWKDDPTSSFVGDIIDDTFEDGVPPPAPANFFGTNSAYMMVGGMGPETGGTLVLGSTTAIPISTPPGATGSFVGQVAVLRSNADGSNPDLGLKTDDTFAVTGIFDLIVPSQNYETYGVRLNDWAPPYAGNDFISILVLRTNDTNQIALRRQDFINQTVTILETAALDTGHDQIALRLERKDSGSNAITASWAYGDAGVFGDYTEFTEQPAIFDGESFTRGAFFASGPAPVPEPHESLMLLAGLGMIGFVARRRLRG
jgi:hypothetical protein